MRILGIDPGIGKTGWALLEEEGGQLILKCSGEIRLSQQIRESRLKLLYTELCKKIGLYRPKVVAVEGTFFAKNAKSAFKLGAANGAARLAAEMNDLPVFEYTPKAVKMAVVGFGGASKDQVKEMVFRILNLSERINSEHEADAAAVAICHAHSAKWQEKQVALL